ncbi:MAG TPA: bifunctional metallophosphatase/5'-nucleotidase [Actinomycetes bacterium]
MSASGLLRRRTPVALAAVLAAALGASISAAPSSEARPTPGKAGNADVTEIQILGLNDFHGAIEPPGGSGGRIGSLTEVPTDPPTTPVPTACLAPTCFSAGGAEYLATHVRALRAENPANTLFVSAGDLIGATPLTSALFHDEPTIEAFNLMGLDFNGVGNHEFDEGVDELLRMQDGGCHPDDGCLDGDGFDGADFGFLAANVKYKDSGETIFPPYAIRKFEGGIKVGIIGMTLEGTPDIVTPTGIQSVNFLDEADSVNALVPHLKAQGVETFVVLLHEGGETSKAGNGAGSVAGLNECGTVSGKLPPIVERMDDEIDVVVTGHTNWAVNCLLDGKVVTGAASNGRLITDIDLTVSRATKDVASVTVNNRIIKRDVPKAADLTTLMTKYQTLAAPLANEVVGSITADITRNINNAGESPYGDVIADAQLAATAAPELGGSKVAFMNPGGIRESLVANQISPGGEAVGEVTYGELFTTQPFSNVLTVLSCTGTQIDALLEQQLVPNLSASPPNLGRILQVSDGFAYTYDAAAPQGSRVNIGSITIDGTPIVAGDTYRVTTNNFLATGGDGFSVFTQCEEPLGGAIDIDALVSYFEANSPVAPGPMNRITRLN